MFSCIYLEYLLVFAVDVADADAGHSSGFVEWRRARQTVSRSQRQRCGHGRALLRVRGSRYGDHFLVQVSFILLGNNFTLLVDQKTRRPKNTTKTVFFNKILSFFCYF